MGLDMYLNSRKKIEGYTKEDWDRVAELFEERYDKLDYGDFVEKVEVLKRGENYKYKSLTDQLAYWRKFNALHQWFVHNVQDDEDDCGEYLVSKEVLEKLLVVLKKVTKKNASKVLPSQSGFFFGNTDYNEWYFKDVAETIDTITNIIEEFDFENHEILYSASW